MKLSHKYVSVKQIYVMMTAMTVNQDLIQMDSNATAAIQRIHGVMILMKSSTMEMMP